MAERESKKVNGENLVFALSSTFPTPKSLEAQADSKLYAIGCIKSHTECPEFISGRLEVWLLIGAWFFVLNFNSFCDNALFLSELISIIERNAKH
ncbi:MAG: hypothetical protein Salg2KO_16390 [Salibacteraceae bacterium]